MPLFSAVGWERTCWERSRFWWGPRVLLFELPANIQMKMHGRELGMTLEFKGKVEDRHLILGIKSMYRDLKPWDWMIHLGSKCERSLSLVLLVCSLYRSDSSSASGAKVLCRWLYVLHINSAWGSTLVLLPFLIFILISRFRCCHSGSSFIKLHPHQVMTFGFSNHRCSYPESVISVWMADWWYCMSFVPS